MNDSQASYDILNGSLIIPATEGEANDYSEVGRISGVSESSMASTPYATF